MSLLVVSPCFYPDAAPAELMVKSARAHGLEVLLYGLGDQFIPHGADAQVKELHHWMKDGEWKADYVLVTDCRDVVFQAGESEIMAKYKAFDKEIVMSSETGCWPPDEEIVRHYWGIDPNGYNYVNAGLYIGKWEYVIGCLEWLLYKYRGHHPGADNSQGWWMWAKMRGELDFALDSECQIFQSMSGGADAQISVTALGAQNVRTGTFPCALHYNGNPSVVDPHGEMYRRLA